MSEVTVITARKAVSLLKKAVNVKGAHHTQTGCYYVTDQVGRNFKNAGGHATPTYGCLVGTALALEVGLPVLTAGIGQCHFNSEGLVSFSDRLPELINVRLTKKAQAIFATAQKYQDRHNTWGDSLARALEK